MEFDEFLKQSDPEKWAFNHKEIALSRISY